MSEVAVMRPTRTRARTGSVPYLSPVFTDELTKTLLGAGLSPGGLFLTSTALHLIRSRAKPLEEYATATDDGGVILEFVSRGGRELLLSFPRRGDVRFFGVREGRFREAGRIDTDEGLEALSRWLASDGSTLDRSARGLAFG